MNQHLLWPRHPHTSNTQIFVVADVSSGAVLPGQWATPVNLDHERQCRRLCALIDRFATEGFPHASGGMSKASREAAVTAKSFLELAKHVSSLPKVGVEDDSVVLAWERGAETMLIVVEAGMLHVVRKAGTPVSTYEENIPFDGQAIPFAVIDSMPAR